MKKTLLLIMVIAVAMSFVSAALMAQPEGPMQGSSVVTYNTYRMDFFKSQQPAMAPSTTRAAEWSTDREYYTDSLVSKGSDGFINATTSWADIPAEVAETAANENVLTGITFGFGRGLASSVTRGAAGVVDMATCIFPPYDEPLAQPEYKVDDPQKDGFKVAIFKW